ncbi:DUF362 domain-containing protein [Myxococcota bacterium]
MSERKPKDLSRRGFLGVSVGAVVAASVGCGSDDTGTGASGNGGTGPGAGVGTGTGVGRGLAGNTTGVSGATFLPGAGGGPAIGAGTAGGSVAGGPALGTAASAGTATAGGPSAGGSSVGNAVARGGSSTTGPGVGGSGTTARPANAGRSSSGASSGGTSSSGASSSGTSSSGAAAGGQSTGGSVAAGDSSGGALTGGEEAKGGAASGGTSSGGQQQGEGGSNVTGGTSAGGPDGTGGTGAGGSGGGEKPLVALVRASDQAQAVQDAILMVGGLPDLSGKTVMLRPNSINGSGSPATTNPEVVRGVIRAIKAQGAPAKIIVAEGAFSGNSLDNMRQNGIAAAATDEGAELLDLNSGSDATHNPPNASAWNGGIRYFNAVTEADYVINVPVCKTHMLANFSMAIKAWLGHLSGNRASAHGDDIGSKVAELHLVRQEDFVVLDATRVLLKGGPTVGSNDPQAEPGIVVASPDAIAADVTGLCVLKHYIQENGVSNNQIVRYAVWEQPQVARAMALAFPGWLSSQQGFPYQAQGVEEADTIMGYREA